MKDVKTISKPNNATELNNDFCKRLLGDYYMNAVVYDIENDISIGGKFNGQSLSGAKNKIDLGFYRALALNAKNMFDNHFTDTELVALATMQGSVNEFMNYDWILPGGNFQPNRKNRWDICLCNYITKDKATGKLGLFAPNSWFVMRNNLNLPYLPFWLDLAPAANSVHRLQHVVFNGRGC